jgi:hypothetical protein
MATKVYLVRCEREEGVFAVLGVFYTDEAAYMFAHERRSASPMNIMEITYDLTTGVVDHTRIEYL